jgi:hypothetical protein
MSRCHSCHVSGNSESKSDSRRAASTQVTSNYQNYELLPNCTIEDSGSQLYSELSLGCNMSNWPSSMDLFDAFSINSQDQLQPMATIPNAMEKRPQKLRRSCETCRNSKARCCPGKEGDDCQRCVSKCVI